VIVCSLPEPIKAQDVEEVDESEEASKKDKTSTHGMSFSGYPYAYYTPETELAFGVGGVLVFYTADEEDLSPSKISLSGYYTTNGQYKISLNPAMYFARDKQFVQLPLSFGHVVDSYWGIGNNTPETGDEQYTLDVVSVTFTVQVPPLWFQADRTGIIFDYDKTDIVDEQDNSLLHDDELLGTDGGESYGIGTDLVWDSRDNIFFPNGGTYQYMKFVVYPQFGDYVYYTLEMDIRHFTALSPDHVIAGNFYFAAAGGNTPFYQLPALGGQNRMRGYFQGRYRDNVYTTLQLEYRQYFWQKFGFVVFGGVGDVASDLLKFKLDEFKHSLGLGLRFLFNRNEKVNLRMDVGFGKDGNSGVYFGLEEAF
jgi:outer membrane protein assembly factor BamA